MTSPAAIRRQVGAELATNGGLLRLAPTWVARIFMHPGRRLKLDPRDYYALGGWKGGINERWFASTTPADNGEFTLRNEGLSFVVAENQGTPTADILFRDVMAEMGAEILGQDHVDRYGGWTAYSKFFDNMGPIAHHVHPRDEHAAKVKMLGKPEAYYFPPQQNNVYNNFPHTYFGLNPDVEKAEVEACLRAWADRGDNNILDLSRAYRLQVGTGWDVPPGILHAPGSLLTYEPQKASDVSLFYQSQVEGRHNDRGTMVKDVPEDLWYDYDYLIEILDWDLNTDPNFKARHFLNPLEVSDLAAMRDQGYEERWVVYGSDAFSAKELTVLPGRSVKIADPDAYGFITMQGHGTANGAEIESPVMIRFGELTADEFFVTKEAAVAGVEITNGSSYQNLVLLKHFGPGNPDSAHMVKDYRRA